MKRNIVIATVAAAALIGGGSALAFAGSDDDTGRSDTRTQQSDSQITLQDDDTDDGDRDDRGDRDDARDAKDDRDDRGDRDDARPADAKLTAVQAIEAALKQQSGTAVSAELDEEDGDDNKAERLAWEVDILGKGDAWHTVHIDAATGKVIGKETEDERDDAREARAALKDARTDAAQAAETAAAKGFVTSVDLDDDGRAGHVSEGWEIETAAADGHDRDWNVDVRSGKLTVDHDDRHDHDGRDDSDDGDRDGNDD
ncbi:PepSY domain-containing protein [Streptomyces sp. Da 82-17]|uniref:PepSY domain-containing protein n=1 Tax=Streptomyces sp. Da 82-17 TaxID=3377116 RepID=UPI0038D3C49E